jgi:hypothetical protein
MAWGRRFGTVSRSDALNALQGAACLCNVAALQTSSSSRISILLQYLAATYHLGRFQAVTACFCQSLNCWVTQVDVSEVVVCKLYSSHCWRLLFVRWKNGLRCSTVCCVQTYINTYVRTYTYIHMYIHIYVHTYTCIHTHIYVHTYTHICT